MNQQLLQNAWRLCQTGNAAEAARLCHQVLRSDPGQIGALHMLAVIHSERGEFAAAEPFLTRAVKLAPGSPVILLHRGNVLFELRRFSEALADYDAALAREPRNALIWNNRGNALAALGQGQQAIESFSRAIAIDPHHTDALVNRADLYSACGRDRDALRDLEKAVENSPSPELHYRRATVLLRMGDARAALSAFDQALALAQEADFHIGRSMALVALKRFDDALSALDSALALTPNNVVALSNRSSVLSRVKRYEDALSCADRVLKLAPDSATGWHNRGTALAGLKQTKPALEAYDRALQLDPQNAQTWNNSGAAMILLDRNEAAIKRFEQALKLNPADAETWSNRAKALANLNRFPEALDDAQNALTIDPAHVPALRMAIHARLRSCDWSRREQDIREAQSALRAARRIMDPLHCLAMFDSGPENLAAAKLWREEECPPQNVVVARSRRSLHDRLRVAYLSTDLRDHAVGFLIAGVIEHHDKTRFEITALSCGPADASATRARMQASFERFIDIRDTSDVDSARLIRDMEIDILVDLNGYTGNQRTAILAFRPAPVQVNYLGYPGTMGSPYIDWIIADPVVIPESQRDFYSEKIALLPDCYQPNDKCRTVAENCPSRAEAGLPDSGFVFCSFNNNYKIAPQIFDVWMRVLRLTPNSVLWLLQDNPAAAANLKREAAARGVSGERVVFASRAKPAAHLARHRLADLCLDTLPYNAHTTASDALWMGLPLITCPGQTFQSRVAASILGAAGMPELIAPSLAGYEALALKFAHDPEFMARTRAKLVANRETCTLFDVERFTRNLEQIYSQIMETF